MKRITCAFLSMLLITPCMANIHINPDAVTEVVAKHFPNKQVECIREYNAQLKASNGTGIVAPKLWNVCAAGGLDIKQPADKEKCKTFVNELTSKGTIKFYAACGKDSKVSGAVCVNDFATLTVNRQQAQGLAKLYARNKSDNTIQCRSKPRIVSTTTTSINPHAMGMSSTTNTPYVQCTSYNGNKFYEFRFNNVDGNIDATNHKNFKTGICKIFGYKYVSKKPEAPADNHQFDICDGIKDESSCNKLDQIISSGNIGYIASWGPLGYKTGRTGYRITDSNFPYCVLSENVAKGNDGYLLFERTAFGLDGRVFLKAGIQRKGSNEIKKQIRTYVENTMGKENVKSFSCEDTYHTIKLKDRSDKDDMLRCTVNDQVVEFFFDDLSEAWDVYDKSGREAMNCIAWGGTFTGKKCIGLDEAQCNIVRDANAQSCPECKLIKWNPNTETCDLPSSANATSLKKGLNYTAIVGGAVVGIVITVGTMGAATAPTALILTGLAVETLGAGIELKAQIDIDRTADKFFTQSANCNDARCAEDIILEYLKTMSNQQNDMLEEELSAADAELERLADLIPAESYFYQRMFGNGTDLASNETGEWTSAQIWRAVGIGLQSISILTGVGKWVIKKSPALQKGLQRTTIAFGKKGKILRNARKVALANVVDYDKLDDVGKEWYKLWQEYAPKDQPFEQFKAMANGNLDEMKQMAKNWTPRSKRPIINAQIDKQLDDITAEIQRRSTTFENLMDKYNIDAMPDDPNELAQLYKQHPDLEQAAKILDYARAQKNKLNNAKAYYNNTSYSTFDPEFSKTFKTQKEIDNLDEQIAAIMAQRKEHSKRGAALYKEADQYDWSDSRKLELNHQAHEEYDKSFELFEKLEQLSKERDVLRENLPTQWQIGQEFQLKNLANVVDERVRVMDDIVTSNASINSKLTKQTWKRLSEQERLDVAQQILDDYATRLGAPKAQVFLDPDAGKDVGGYYKPGTNEIYLNPKAQFNSADELTEILSHEYGHLVDDLAPNEGALGSQYSYYGNKIYSNQEKAGYRIALTEQSSYAIGNTTGRTAEKTLDQAAAAGLGAVGGATIEIGVMDQLTNK